jgi:hypothetical protein
LFAYRSDDFLKSPELLSLPPEIYARFADVLWQGGGATYFENSLLSSRVRAMKDAIKERYSFTPNGETHHSLQVSSYLFIYLFIY